MGLRAAARLHVIFAAAFVVPAVACGNDEEKALPDRDDG